MNMIEQTRKIKRRPSNKNADSTIARMMEMSRSLRTETDPDVIENTEAKMEHMVGSLVSNRDKQIHWYKNRLALSLGIQSLTQKMITGSLRDTINQHGDITLKVITSASKRIYGNLYQKQQQRADQLAFQLNKELGK